MQAGSDTEFLIESPGKAGNFWCLYLLSQNIELKSDPLVLQSYLQKKSYPLFLSNANLGELKVLHKRIRPPSSELPLQYTM